MRRTATNLGQDTLACRDSGLSVKKQVDVSAKIDRGSSASSPLLSPRASRPVGLEPSKTISQSHLELTADFHDFSLSIQRLRLQIISVIYAGAYSACLEKGEFKLKPNAPQQLAALKDDELPVAHKITALNELLPGSELRRDLNLGEVEDKLIRGIVSQLLYGRALPDEHGKRYEEVLEKATALQRTIIKSAGQTDLFSDNNLTPELLRSLRTQWREIIKEAALVLEAGNYFSPTYGASGAGQRGPNQHVRPMVTDYQRNKMDEIALVERELADQVRRKISPSRRDVVVESYLFQTGLHALDSTLHAVYTDYAGKKENLKVRPLPQNLMITKGVYFEVEGVCERHAKVTDSSIKYVNPSDTQKLLAQILEEQPRAVITAKLGNSLNMPLCDVAELIELLSSPKFVKAWQDTALERLKATMTPRQVNRFLRDHTEDLLVDLLIEDRGRGKHRPTPIKDRPLRVPYYLMPELTLIVDETALSSTPTWSAQAIAKLPEFIHVVTIESLVKYRGGGLELAQGGLASTIQGGSRLSGLDLSIGLFNARRLDGTMPPETSVRRASLLPEGDIISRRIDRFNRNSRALATFLEQNIPLGDSVFEAVIHPELESYRNRKMAAKIVDGAGAVFRLQFNAPNLYEYSEFSSSFPVGGNRSPCQNGHDLKKRSELVAESFIKLAIEIAKQRKVDLNLGTSFGFDTTRLAAYEEYSRVPGKGTEKEACSHIRIAVGTEDIEQLLSVGEVIADAANLIGSAYNYGCLIGQCLTITGPKGIGGALNATICE